MTDRYTAFLAIMAQRDAALVSLALLCLAALVGWVAVRAALSPNTQDRIIAGAGIVFYLTLLAIIVTGGSTT